MTTTAARTLDVTGMTCGHCVHAVTEELTALDGVAGVDVELQAGGTSHVTVTTTTDVPEDALRAAVDEAGYALVAVR
ncbi:heavy-metal-associated domain-containing protein [Luteimicrobium subarcticum]|uniref:Copper chaperone CopZ n=1 Tax=Luteimicrobium subarcticum TaxID=620910 RepID=A0A2M8WRT7_9MICO|nr:heavy-metal-associated domain-containing protein [Luteimicrobium subarcticum]PJI93651.1 copper chaperone CopZ [Luteimicrobium subarcticum]